MMMLGFKRNKKEKQEKQTSPVDVSLGVKKHLFALIVNRTNKEWYEKNGAIGFINFIGSYDGEELLPVNIEYPFVYTWMDLAHEGGMRMSFNTRDIKFYCQAVIESLGIDEVNENSDGIINEVIDDFVKIHTGAFFKLIEEIDKDNF
ncbi:hypothetical protein [Klebsiella aerogenes]|uniref:hypothetical protein n=1 Tax=Klebsiella aerogenes TaxID=548 RepID=UPI001D0D70F3|nr:hypothetical protein [Klebsiella aerogenes]